MKTTIVIMAAGLGSRYGGIKQMDSVGPNGEILMEYSIFDAVRAGFDDVVIILRPDIIDEFRERFGATLEKNVELRYALQSFDTLPSGFIPPKDRKKPYGTVHAVLSARNVIHNNFAVVNADDFYGFDTFRTIHDSLMNISDSGEMSMIAYKLCNTLSSQGGVTRGICEVEHGVLRDIKETRNILMDPDGVIRSKHEEVLEPDSPVSMNIWGCTPWIFGKMEKAMDQFLHSSSDDELVREFILADFVDEGIKNGSLQVSVRGTESKWFGVTYNLDHALVCKNLRELHEEGAYPEKLFSRRA